jgi:PEP-CTERM motif
MYNPVDLGLLGVAGFDRHILGRRRNMRAGKGILLFVVLTFGAVCTQAGTMLPLPAQSSPYTGNVRGYWFTAPVAFDIVGVGVPTDASTGPQTIEIVRFNSAVPAFPSTTNDFTSLFRVVSDPSLGMLTASIPVQSGDIIGVLGYRSTVNSYGPAGFVSDIFGNPVTLSRLGMQYSLVSDAAHDLWTETGSSISRVNLEYDSPTVSGVPEPSTFLLLGGSLLLLASFGWKKRRLHSEN